MQYYFEIHLIEGYPNRFKSGDEIKERKKEREKKKRRL